MCSTQPMRSSPSQKQLAQTALRGMQVKRQANAMARARARRERSRPFRYLHAAALTKWLVPKTGMPVTNSWKILFFLIFSSKKTHVGLDDPLFIRMLGLNPGYPNVYASKHHPLQHRVHAHQNNPLRQRQARVCDNENSRCASASPTK